MSSLYALLINVCLQGCKLGADESKTKPQPQQSGCVFMGQSLISQSNWFCAKQTDGSGILYYDRLMDFRVP